MRWTKIHGGSKLFKQVCVRKMFKDSKKFVKRRKLKYFVKTQRKKERVGTLDFYRIWIRKKYLHEIDMKFSSKVPKLNQNEINIVQPRDQRVVPERVNIEWAFCVPKWDTKYWIQFLKFLLRESWCT